MYKAHYQYYLTHIDTYYFTHNIHISTPIHYKALQYTVRYIRTHTHPKLHTPCTWGCLAVEQQTVCLQAVPPSWPISQSPTLSRGSE